MPIHRNADGTYNASSMDGERSRDIPKAEGDIIAFARFRERGVKDEDIIIWLASDEPGFLPDRMLETVGIVDGEVVTQRI